MQRVARRKRGAVYDPTSAGQPQPLSASSRLNQGRLEPCPIGTVEVRGTTRGLDDFFNAVECRAALDDRRPGIQEIGLRGRRRAPTAVGVLAAGLILQACAMESDATTGWLFMVAGLLALILACMVAWSRGPRR